MKSSLFSVLVVATAALFAGSAVALTVAYEGFDYQAGTLGSASGGEGWSSNWSSNGTTNVAGNGLTYGDLVTTGGSIGNLSGGQNRFGAARSLNLATPGLLDDGSELWFSALMGYGAGGNRTNATLMLVLGDEAMSGGNFDYNYNTPGATGLGIFVGRQNGVNGKIQAVQIRDTTFGNVGFAGNVYGTGGGTQILPAAPNTNIDYRLVVGQIIWGASSDTINLYLPDEELNLGGIHSTLTVDVDQSGFDVLTFKRGDRVVLDEIRFGSSAGDVLPAPTPEPTSSVLALLGIGGLLITRRRHA